MEQEQIRTEYRDKLRDLEHYGLLLSHHAAVVKHALRDKRLLVTWAQVGDVAHANEQLRDLLQFLRME